VSRVRSIIRIAPVLAALGTLHAAAPVVERVSVGGKVLWSTGAKGPVQAKPGETVVVEGRNFGPDAVGCFSQVTINRAGPLKTDIDFHRHRVDPFRFKQFADHATVQDTQKKELLSWTDTRIEFQVPLFATSGDLVVTVQPAIGNAKSIVHGGPVTYEPEYVVRGKDKSKEVLPRVTLRDIGLPLDSNAVPFVVSGQEETIRAGREMFYFWPQYSHVAYALSDAKLEKLLAGTLTDLDGETLDLYDLGWYVWPQRAHRWGEPEKKPGKPAAVSIGPLEPPAPPTFVNAFRSIVFPLGRSGPDVLPRVTIRSFSTEWIGIVETEFPNALTGAIGVLPGITCASCHTSEIRYKLGGREVSELIAGLPNPRMDFHRAFQYVNANLKNNRDRRRVAASYGPGVLDFTSAHEDDGIYNPVTIGSHYGREALHRLSTAGLEGSIHHRNNMAYIHHGGLGRPTLEQSTALQAYINSTQADLDRVRVIGFYNWLDETKVGKDAKDPSLREQLLPAGVELEQFLRIPPDRYAAELPKLHEAMESGRTVFQGKCIDCHTPFLGLNTSQKVIPLDRIGSYLPPSDRMIKSEGIRVAPLTHLHWRAQAGYLHDNHVESLEDLLHPRRAKAGSELHTKYYTISERTRRIKSTTDEQRRAADALNYFTETAAPKDAKSDAKTTLKAFDYGKFRAEFGKAEYGKPVVLPEVPHPFFVSDPQERRALILYLNSL